MSTDVSSTRIASANLNVALMIFPDQDDEQAIPLIFLHFFTDEFKTIGPS
jgi:hypothetical protein